jgi:DNA primase
LNREKKINLLESVLGPRHGTGDELVFFCPNHGSRPGRVVGQLSVNVKTDFFHCWSCGFGGKNLVPIFKIKKLHEEIREYLEEFRATKKEEKTLVDAKLPQEFKTLSSPTSDLYNRAALTYLKDRGVTREDILRMKLGYCDEGDYKYRIIFPSFDEFGSLNFVTGRTFVNDYIKYMQDDEVSKNIIFNDYLINWQRSITLVEGPFDALKAGDNSLPLLGNHFLDENSRLFLKIVSQQDHVYLALDSDARRMQEQVAELLLSYGVKLSWVSSGKFKDAGDMTHEQFQEAKRSSFNVSSSADLMRLRLTWV